MSRPGRARSVAQESLAQDGGGGGGTDGPGPGDPA